MRGGRALEEAGSNLVGWCSNAAIPGLIRDGENDQFEEKEGGDEKEECAGVVWKVGKEEDGQDREACGQQLPETDFGVAGHPALV